MTTRACAACGGSTIRPLLRDQVHHGTRTPDGWHYQLLGCDTCGLGFVDPEPTSAELATFYSADYGPYVAGEQSPQAVAHSVKYKVARMRHATATQRPTRRLEAALGLLVEHATGKTVSYSLGMPLQLPTHARIFEMGYGAGVWLLSMHALGYHDLYGYDIAPNDQHAEALRERGVNVSSGSFLDNDYPLGTFDCIRLEHVVEHLTDPVRVLEKVRAMLKPGGLLVMNLPCIESWSARLSIEHFPHLDLPRHLYHHTPRSLALMLRASGFDEVSEKAYGDVAALAGTVNGLLGVRHQPAIPLALFRLLAPAYSLACELTGKGDLVTVMARAPRTI